MSLSSDSAQSLNEISHLFLSSVRERQMDGAPRPQRIPPGAPRRETEPRREAQSQHSIDLSPEEFAADFAASGVDLMSSDNDADPVKPLAIALGAHFGADYRERVRAYARHLARTAGRVGLIFADDSSIELSCLDKTELTGIEPDAPIDIDTFISVVGELNCDVNRWLIAGVNPRPIFDQPRTAVLLASCDHEGVIEAYRTLKGLTGYCPEHVGVALFEARDLRAAERVHRKLAGVADQFLGCAIDLSAIVIPAPGINCHPLATVPASDEAWQRIAEFFATAPAATITPESSFERMPSVERTPMQAEIPQSAKVAEPVKAAAPIREIPIRENSIDETLIDKTSIAEMPVQQPLRNDGPAGSAPLTLHPQPAGPSDFSEVLDLPSGQADDDSILSAMVRDGANSMVECPLRPPMLSNCRMVVDRQRRLSLIAVATQGLSDLRAIAGAYRWLTENRSLVAMALPQMNIDAHTLPQLRLLIDQHDAAAAALQTLMQSGCVQLQSYRKLRWGGKTGLLLEAA